VIFFDICILPGPELHSRNYNPEGFYFLTARQGKGSIFVVFSRGGRKLQIVHREGGSDKRVRKLIVFPKSVVKGAPADRTLFRLMYKICYRYTIHILFASEDWNFAKSTCSIG